MSTNLPHKNDFQNPLSQNGNMHPQDKRNLLVFFMLFLSAIFAYNQLFVKPERARQEALKAQLAATAPAPGTAPAVQAPPAPDAKPVARADALAAETGRLEIDTPALAGSLYLKGARFDDLRLKSYFDDLGKKENVALLSPARTEYPQFFEFGWVLGADSAGKAVALPTKDAQWEIEEGDKLTDKTPVTLKWENDDGLTFRVKLSVDAQYMLTAQQSVESAREDSVTLHPYTLLTRHGLPPVGKAAGVSADGPIGYMDEALQEVPYSKFKKDPVRTFTAQNGWIGLGEKYWFAGMIPDGAKTRSWRMAATPVTPEKSNYQTDVTGAPIVIAPKQTVTDTVRLYVGPKKLDILKSYQGALNIPRFDLVIDFGWFWFLTIPFFHLLNWLGQNIGSFALALLVFTVIVRLATFPLANKSYRSFARMRKIAPQMKEIQDRYKDNRESMQKAIFELYQKEKVNPMAGCFPILLQIPIFFALYKVLFITIEMRQQPFWGWIADMSAPDPTSVFNLFGVLPFSTPAMLTIGVWPILMAFTLFLQQQMSPPVQDATQRQVMKLMPIMMLFMMAHFPAGLVIYWTWSNTLSVIQQYVLMKQEGVEPHLFTKFKKK